MQHNLLATMQLRLNDLIVNNIPKFLTDKPNEFTHTVTVRGKSADPDDRIVIPLTIHGVTSSYPTRKPSAQEYESCRLYDLTFESPDYNPHDITYSRQEQVTLDALALPETGDRVHCIMSVSSSAAQAKQTHNYYSCANALLSEISPVLDNRLFLLDLEFSRIISSVKAITQRPGINAETLSRNWGIGQASARRTLEANPVEVAEYAIAQGIHDKPAFLWWVPYTIKRHNRIIGAINARYHKRTYKFGI
jgi:hypothetical protein